MSSEAQQSVPTGGPQAAQPRDLVFFSYAHKDAKWLALVKKVLKPALKDSAMKTWADSDIKPGQKWKDEITKALGASRVAVLLVTMDFLASDFVDKQELPPLLDAAEKHGLIILWIYVDACMYKVTPIADYEAAHDVAKPLKKLTPANRALVLVEIANKIIAAYNGVPDIGPDLFIAASADTIVEAPESR